MTLPKKRSLFLYQNAARKNLRCAAQAPLNLATIAHVGTREARWKGQSALPPRRVRQPRARAHPRSSSKAEGLNSVTIRREFLILFFTCLLSSPQLKFDIENEVSGGAAADRRTRRPYEAPGGVSGCWLSPVAISKSLVRGPIVADCH